MSMSADQVLAAATTRIKTVPAVAHEPAVQVGDVLIHRANACDGGRETEITVTLVCPRWAYYRFQWSCPESRFDPITGEGASPSDGQVRTVEGWRQHDRSVDVRGRFLEAIKDADRHRYRQVPIDDMLTVIAILRGSADTANHAAAVEWASAIPRSSVDT